MKRNMKSTAEIEREMMDAAERGLRMGVDLILSEAARRAPVDTGALRESLTEQDLERTVRGISIKFGSDLPYAAAQHEGITFDHPKGGESKFLESALKSHGRRAVQLMAEEIRRAMK